MADILIRGMEMSKSCDECRLFNECWCMALGIENWRKSYNKPPEGERLPDCPLVPLPEGHGRLIDADKLTPDMGNYITGGSGTVGSMCTSRGYSQRQIDNAPTILEAEAKEY